MAPGQLAAALAARWSPTAWIELELTDSVVMNPERTPHILERLRAMGFHLGSDDLGTGYSSLAYLNRRPVDEIKN